jgi:hypothetical protein
MPAAAGGTNMQRYGSVFVKFVPLNEDTKGKILSIQKGTPGVSTTPYTIIANIPNGTSNTVYRSSSPGTSTNSANVVTNFYADVTNANFENGKDTYAITDNVSNDVDRAFWFVGEKVAY